MYLGFIQYANAAGRCAVVPRGCVAVFHTRGYPKCEERNMYDVCAIGLSIAWTQIQGRDLPASIFRLAAVTPITTILQRV